jgi:hypothetical protein
LQPFTEQLNSQLFGKALDLGKKKAMLGIGLARGVTKGGISPTLVTAKMTAAATMKNITWEAWEALQMNLSGTIFETW